jgi:ATP-dependent Lon protease
MEKTILPGDNRDDWEELDQDIREAMPVAFVETIEEAFALLFGSGILKKKTAGKPGSKTRKKQPQSTTGR